MGLTDPAGSSATVEGGVQAVLFGSLATGQESERSDVDLLVVLIDRDEFGDDFDLDVFQAAYDSEDPAELNWVKAVERGVEQLYNYMAELAAFGWSSPRSAGAGRRRTPRVDLDALSRIGVVGPERTRRLQRLRELRRRLVQECAAATAEQVHETARIISSESVAFFDAYRAWIGRGFSPHPPK